MKKFLLISICTLILSASPAWGTIYSWRGEDGVLHYTNDERDVPLNYRKENNLQTYSWRDEKTGEVRYASTKEDVPPQYRKQAGVEVYRYIGLKGEIQYAFDLKDIPPQYRSKAVKEIDEASSAAVVSTPAAPPPQRAESQQPQAQTNPFVEAIRTYQRYKEQEVQQPQQAQQEPTNPFIEAIKRSQRMREQREGGQAGQE